MDKWIARLDGQPATGLCRSVSFSTITFRELNRGLFIDPFLR